MAPITENEIRQFMRDLLERRAIKAGGRVYEELGIEQGSARVDFAIVSELLEAYELKSDLDNLGRLHNQIHAYNRVFDRITLVTGPEHANAAAAVAPSWWGLIEIARQKGTSMSARVIRDAKVNPLQQAQSLAALLWRTEAAALLEEKSGQRTPTKLNKAQLYGQLADKFTLDRLRDVVATCLLDRDYSMLAVNTK